MYKRPGVESVNSYSRVVEIVYVNFPVHFLRPFSSFCSRFPYAYIASRIYIIRLESSELMIVGGFGEDVYNGGAGGR